MQRTADFSDAIANAGLPQAAGIVDDATARDTAGDVLKAHTATRDAPMRRVLRACEVPASRLPGGHEDLHLVTRDRQEPEILEPAAARGQGLRAGLGHPLIVGAAGRRVTPKADRARGGDQPDVFPRVACFLATITARLLRRILGAFEAPCGAIVPTRGAVGAAVGGCSGGTTRAVASASAAPIRFASSVKDRAGVSPSVRRVACRTTNRT